MTRAVRSGVDVAGDSEAVGGALASLHRATIPAGWAARRGLPSVRTDDGGALVSKVAWRHPEVVHEADALRVWNRDGAVQLGAADEFGVDTMVLLVEWADEFERRWTPDRSGARSWSDPRQTRPVPGVSGTADRAVSLCSDLHADTVLLARREPGLVGDSKP
jgi:streptomycin 6-kinase